MATSALGYQSFYQAQLTSAISSSDLTIPLDVVPTPSEGFLVIESTSSTKREIIYYTSKTVNSVVCPSGGRGYDGTTAQSHTQNSIVIMAPVAAMFSSMRDLFETTPQGWTPVTQTVSSVTYNGNRSYSLTMSADVSATLSPGMRVRTTRTVSAPTQCTSLNGTSQYWSKTTPTGLSFTTTFTCSAWVKLTSYGSTGHIIGRRNGATEGWNLEINASGQLSMVALRILANNRYGTTYQSIPLNKWVHVAASMNVGVAGNSAHNMYIDGVLVQSFDTTNGTITALVQGTTALAVGAQNTPSAYFPGKIAQAAVFSSVLTQATIQGYISQGLSGTETNLVSAYSFNGNANDLNTTNANNLTASGSAVATNADSPFSTNSFGTETGTLDYGIVQSVATTTVVVQVPEGCTIPTSGGVTSISYSTQKAPYGMPVSGERWEIQISFAGFLFTPVNATWYNINSQSIDVPIGDWEVSWQAGAVRGAITSTTSTYISGLCTLSVTSAANGTVDEQRKWQITFSIDGYATAGSTMTVNVPAYRSAKVVLSSLTRYYLNYYISTGGTIFSASAQNGTLGGCILRAMPALL